MPSKKSHIQLYADECFPVPSSTYLKSLGLSVVHSYDYNYVKKTDHFHLAKSKQMKRVLITLDRDFIYYERVHLENHPGVIVISSGSAIPLNIDKICSKLFKEISDDFVKDSLLKVTADKIVKIKDGKIIFEKNI